MNQQSRFSIPIGYQFGIAIALAVFLPIVLLGVFSRSTALSVGLDNLEIIVNESGQRRQQAVENDLRAALNALNDYLADADNLDTLTTPLAERLQQGTSTNLYEDETLAQYLRNDLLTTAYFNSAWLMTSRTATPFAIGQVRDVNLPISRVLDGNNLVIFDAADSAAERGLNQTLVLLEDDGRAHLLFARLLFVADDVTAELTHVGTLVVDVNLDAVFVENLELIGGLPTTSFVVMPNDAIVASQLVLESGLIDLASDGLQTVRSTAGSGLITYTVGTGSTRTEVLGYYATITFLGEDFLLLSEVETSIVPAQLNPFVSTASFVAIIGGAGLAFVLVIILYYLFVPPILNLRDAMRALARGDFEEPVSGTARNDELGSLAATFVEMRGQVQRFQEDSERRVATLNRDVRVTQNIARTITAERDLQLLMDTVVNEIVSNFPSIYHAQIFLVDSDETFAVLRASTGEAGRQLLQRGHKLAVGSVSVIGQVTEQNQVIIARDTAESDVHRQNEFLRDTRAELAIPLQVGERIIGALDVQSRQRDSFDEDQTQALRTLADQISIAIENARLYEEFAQLLKGAELQQDRSARHAWGQFIQRQDSDMLVTRSGNATDFDFSTLRDHVFHSGKSMIGDVTERGTVPFVVPITLRGLTLGVVEYELRQSEFSYDKVLLAEELVNRLAISLDNARLFRESQQATERERIVNDISTKLTGQNNIQDIIETAIREVSQALQTPKVAVRFHLEEPTPPNGSNGNGQMMAEETDR